jgi:hypothetical protein
VCFSRQVLVVSVLCSSLGQDQVGGLILVVVVVRCRGYGSEGCRENLGKWLLGWF